MAKRTSKVMMWVYILIVIMFLAMIMSFKTASDFVGDKVNIAGDKIGDIAKTVLGAGVGVYLIGAGVAALTVPFIGIALIALGVVIAAYFLWPWLNTGKG